LKEREQEEAIRKSQSNLEQSLADYQKEAGGIKGFMNRFLGRGTSLPPLAGETPEYTKFREEDEESVKKTFGENIIGAGKFIGSAIIEAEKEVGEAISDVVNIKAQQEIVIRKGEEYKKFMGLALKETDEKKKKTYQNMASQIYQESLDEAEKVGGDIKDKTNKELIATSVEFAIDIGTLGASKILSTVYKMIPKAYKATKTALVLKNEIKASIKAVEEFKKASKVKKSAKFLGETGGFGAIYGATGEARQDTGDSTATDYAKSTGLGLGLGLGIGVGGKVLTTGASKIYSKLTSKKVVQNATKTIEKELGALTDEETKIIEKSVLEGDIKEDIVSGIKESREVDDILGTKPEVKVEKPKVKEVKFEKDTEVTVGGKEAKIVKEKFGKVEVEFADGTKKQVAPSEVKEINAGEKSKVSKTVNKKKEEVKTSVEKEITKAKSEGKSFDDVKSKYNKNFDDFIDEYEKTKKTITGDKVSKRDMTKRSAEIDAKKKGKEYFVIEDEFNKGRFSTAKKGELDVKITDKEAEALSKKYPILIESGVLKLNKGNKDFPLTLDFSGKEKKFKQLWEGTKATPKKTPKVEPKTESKKTKQKAIPKTAESDFAKRLNKEIPDEFKLDEQYEVARMKDEIIKASELIAKDKDKASRIAMGTEKTDELTQTATNIELTELAKRDKDWGTVNELLTARRKAGTRRGQEIAMEKISILMNPEEKFMKDVVNARLGKIKITGKDLKKAEVMKKKTDFIKKDIKKATKVEVKLSKAQELLDKLIC